MFNQKDVRHWQDERQEGRILPNVDGLAPTTMPKSNREEIIMQVKLHTQQQINVSAKCFSWHGSSVLAHREHNTYQVYTNSMKYVPIHLILCTSTLFCTLFPFQASVWRCVCERVCECNLVQRFSELTGINYYGKADTICIKRGNLSSRKSG